MRNIFLVFACGLLPTACARQRQQHQNTVSPAVIAIEPRLHDEPAPLVNTSIWRLQDVLDARAELQLSDAQTHDLSTLRSVFVTEVEPLETSLRTTHRALQTCLAQPIAAENDRRCLSLTEALASDEGTLKRLHMQLLLGVRAVLTESQRMSLAQRFD